MICPDYTYTFGICTDGQNPDRLKACVESIKDEYYSGDRIVVVGGKQDGPFTWIPFDETIKPGWITKKKNLITECSRTDYIVYMHDYVSLMPGWRDGFEKFTDSNPIWLTATNPILNQDGLRFRDWAVIFNDSWMNPPIDNELPPEHFGAGRLLNYDSRKLMRWFYYSGAYFVASREVMLGTPLDESRIHCGGEDVQHARLLYKEYGESVFNFNPYSKVQFLKQKDRAPWEVLPPL